MMIPENNQMEQRGRWYKPQRCSICKSFIWLSLVTLKESTEAPEPHQEWVLCEPCYDALLMEMRRASLQSPVRLRIALGIVAAERSPRSSTLRATPEGQQTFQREFMWFTWCLILFGLLHLVIFAVIWLK